MTRMPPPRPSSDPEAEVPDTTVRDLVKAYARIAELEAATSPEATQRHYMRGYNAANAKRRRVYVAELESDRDRLSRIIDTLGADNRRTEAERDKLRGELALVRLAYASVITERDRLKAALTKIVNDEEGDYDLLVYVARAALSGEGVKE